MIQGDWGRGRLGAIVGDQGLDISIDICYLTSSEDGQKAGVHGLGRDEEFGVSVCV